ncbi:MAG: hypothetical protein F6J94_23075 [Moorea sp. SIO1F2]|uniref:Uncharacterized protein n=1 Tax=Moorena producens PAL-8-15-08-1 TaxID=1458985 RepID=A0A1D8TW90_9CYAN|nr:MULTISPECIES: hypothetical protein [Moorena]AOX01921.1 hypothetical protein BJP34_23035 [Moorena producens PAL-8-15-08-1]NEO19989.1 hypothetical protein [Moorena sp. SIO4A5]NEO76860.1 hypothetical protein [Moorena sp. SIO4G3]NEQ59436.1 hypothetical protein [Moorena sp. SIO4A1]NET84693.1 hypothetical protein [Moorena sp. SIO1F2]
MSEFTPNSNKQPVKHILKGSRKAVLNTMYALYGLRYAEISEWSPLQPTEVPGEFITIMTKYLLLP